MNNTNNNMDNFDTFPRRKTQYLISYIFLLSLSLSLFSGFAEGLECYECLSLTCPSGAICESIKKSMIEIFVPKRHVIHFDPNDPCPENEDPKNSTRWSMLTRECQRSDSVCLVSPIEILSIIDGAKGGKRLDSQYEITTTGFLRGCASRRKLLENDATIKVQVNLVSTGKAGMRNSTLTAPRSSSNSSYNMNPNYNEIRSKSNEVYNMMHTEESDVDLSKLKFDDDYVISKVYSHAFYIDANTDNATKCYENYCNAMVRLKSNGGRRLGLGNNYIGSNLVLLGAVMFVVIFNQVILNTEKDYSSKLLSTN